MGQTLGWPIDDAPPAIGDTARWLSSALDLVGADSVMLQCDTARGETVYVEDRDGRLLVSDRGETCRYLEAGEWPYRKIDIDTIRRLCAERGALLVHVSEMWPHITVDPTVVETVARGVAIVGNAIEHVFATAVEVPRP